MKALKSLVNAVDHLALIAGEVHPEVSAHWLVS